MTREEWLLKALEIVRAYMQEKSGAVVPANVRVSCGFPGGRGGSNRKVIGQCWPTQLSADESTEIFISPTQANPLEVLAILVHEAVHAAVGCKHGHKAPFKRVAVACGLEGKMTATTAGEVLRLTMLEWVLKLGDYPHAALSLDGGKKQSTRLVKVECGECGYTLRTTRKWLEKLGAPICPCNDRVMGATVSDDDGDES